MMKYSSLLSIKKPCQNIDTSCTDSDRSTFGKLPPDIRALPAKKLSPIGKLVFTEYAERARGTNRPVLASDREIAKGCGVSRTSVISALKQLLVLRVFERTGNPVDQVQAYCIRHPLFKAAGSSAKKVEHAPVKKPHEEWVECPRCHKERPSLLRIGICRACNKKLDTEHIARRVAREEIERLA